LIRRNPATPTDPRNACSIRTAGTGFDHHRKVTIKPLVEIDEEEPAPEEPLAEPIVSPKRVLCNDNAFS
jgi:hypothetical protein